MIILILKSKLGSWVVSQPVSAINDAHIDQIEIEIVAQSSQRDCTIQIGLSLGKSQCKRNITHKENTKV